MVRSAGQPERLSAASTAASSYVCRALFDQALACRPRTAAASWWACTLQNLITHIIKTPKTRKPSTLKSVPGLYQVK